MMLVIHVENVEEDICQHQIKENVYKLLIIYY